MGYLGSVTLLALVVLGYLSLSYFWIVPLAVINTFIGMHFPSGKANLAKSRGLYFRSLISSFPLQLLFAAVFYGLGYGLFLLFT